jgi:sigma-E factor negative regulatory protein RseA
MLGNRWILMSEQNRPQSIAESLSALMDNQASELELQRILKASDQDPEVKATWSRYQMTSTVLRGEPVAFMADFSARVSAAIADEELHAAAVIPNATAQSKQSKQGWWYQFGRVALVASVAGSLILGVQQFNSSSQVAPVMASAPVAPVAPDAMLSLPSGINAPALNTRTVAVQTGYESRPQENRRVTFLPRQTNTPVSDEEVTRYVNKMIQAHSDNAAMNSGQGVLPYSRVIITDHE